jgi:hypothetical protein
MSMTSCVVEDEKSRRPEADSSDPRASEGSAAARDQWRRQKAQNWTELLLLHCIDERNGTGTITKMDKEGK